MNSRIIRNIKTSTVRVASRIVLEVLSYCEPPCFFCCARMHEEYSLRISWGAWKSDRTGQWCYTQHLQKSHSSTIGTNMKTTLAISFFGPHLRCAQTSFDACSRALIFASCLIAFCSSRCSRNIADVWDHLVQTSMILAHTPSLKSLSCRSLIGVPILFAGLWGIIIARNLTWAPKHLWMIARFLFLRLALAVQVRFYWYYLVLSFIIDLASWLLWLRFLLQCRHTIQRHIMVAAFRFVDAKESLFASVLHREFVHPSRCMCALETWRSSLLLRSRTVKSFV